MDRLKIEGMTCNHCALHVKQALLAVPGVESADVSLTAHEAVIHGTASLQALQAAVEAAGYTARPA